MEWVKDFYRKQNEWAQAYLGEVTPENRQKAETVCHLAPDQRGGSLLELGAGGGQNAAVLSEAGFSVTTIDLDPSNCENARRLSESFPDRKIRVLEGDFFQIELPETFDLVCYLDGFGIGTDSDQRRLLGRIASWLAPGGTAVIEIYTPWYWAANAGREIRFGKVVRKYDFDHGRSVMLDRWQAQDSPTETVTQRLRCYSPPDLALLLEGTGLALDRIEPGSGTDHQNGRFIEKAPLSQAMQYFARLVHKPFAGKEIEK